MKPLQFASRLFTIAGISFFFVSCSNDPKNTDVKTDSSTVIHDTSHNVIPPDTATVPMVMHAEAVITGTYADTAVNGTVKFDADAGKGEVTMVLEITVPKKANRSVAVHLHEHGDCGDTAKLAHGHWNPEASQHGKWDSGNSHAGDIGNVKLDAKGKGTVTITTNRWTLGGMASKNVLGKALIVHGGVDDYITQPTGNAGTRIGCGVIK